jgi:basic membrane protein A and related proteins
VIKCFVYKIKGGIGMGFRRLLYIFMIIMCTIFMAGCAVHASPDDYAVNEGYEVKGSSSKNTGSGDAGGGTSGIAKDKIKVGVIHLSDPAEGSGYTYTHDIGIQGMQQNLGLSDSQIIRKNNISDTDEAATRKAIQECIDAGCNIIFTTSWGYMQTTADMAEEYPDVYFSHGTGYMSNGKNFNNYFGRIYQARYLSGIAAGLNTKTNKIGYVAAMGLDNSEVTGGIDAFALGIYSINPDAKVYVKVTNSWYDPKGEEEAAKTLLNMNCDVIAQHCDTVYPQTLAQEKGVYSIGYNSDMSKEAPEACICSVIWNWSAYYTSAVQSIIDGTWDGSNYYGGMNENLVSITPIADFAADTTQEKVNVAKQQILSGKNGVFDGAIETNTGATVGTAGKTLDDAVITGGINWYFKTVNVIE